MEKRSFEGHKKVEHYLAINPTRDEHYLSEENYVKNLQWRGNINYDSLKFLIAMTQYY